MKYEYSIPDYPISSYSRSKDIHTEPHTEMKKFYGKALHKEKKFEKNKKSVLMKMISCDSKKKKVPEKEKFDKEYFDLQSIPSTTDHTPDTNFHLANTPKAISLSFLNEDFEDNLADIQINDNSIKFDKFKREEKPKFIEILSPETEQHLDFLKGFLGSSVNIVKEDKKEQENFNDQNTKLSAYEEQAEKHFKHHDKSEDSEDSELTQKDEDDEDDLLTQQEEDAIEEFKENFGENYEMAYIVAQFNMNMDEIIKMLKNNEIKINREKVYEFIVHVSNQGPPISLLFWAFKNDLFDMVKYLIEIKHFDVNEIDSKTGRPILIYILYSERIPAEKKNFFIVQLIEEFGSDFLKTDSLGYRFVDYFKPIDLLLWAINNQSVNITQYIVQNKKSVLMDLYKSDDVVHENKFILIKTLIKTFDLDNDVVQKVSDIKTNKELIIYLRELISIKN